MALIVFTIADAEDGIDVQARAEPFFPSPGSDEEMTPAQTLALLMLGAAQETLSFGVEEEEPVDEGKPQLVVVGDE
jgi:hypothetical protein